jgi:DNA-binding NarL/FixJ family response regulator
MPDGSGIDALKYIKRSAPQTEVIMLTNHANPFYQRACIRAGARYFFDKSTEFKRVSEVLNQMVRGIA